MTKAGFDANQATRIWVKVNQRQSVKRSPVRFVMNPDWFMQPGLVFLHDSFLPSLIGPIAD